MNVNLLKAYMTVVSEGSFSRAAERLFISQPALSQNIKQLENHFAVQLIKRTPHGLTLTEFGEALYNHATKICAAIELMEQEMSSFRASLKETLQVGATNVIGDFAVPCSIFIFKKNTPKPTSNSSSGTGTKSWSNCSGTISTSPSSKVKNRTKLT